MTSRFAAVVLLGVASSACSLLFRFDGYAGDASVASPADAADGPRDGAVDAGCGPLALVGTVATETGLSTQTHVAYANHAKRWWLFYITDADPSLLRTRSSLDFCTWSEGAALTLPYVHGGEGRNFSVAYADLGSADVFHISVSHSVDLAHRYHTHARAVASGSSIAFDTPTLVGSPYLKNSVYPGDPDGPVTVVGSDGFVTDLTGWVAEKPDGGVADENVFRSAGPDDGASFNEAFGPCLVLQNVPSIVNARAAVPLLGGGLLAFFEDGKVEPDPPNVDRATFDGVSWSMPVSVFPVDATQGFEDWTVLRVSNTEVHVVRRGVLSGAYDYQRFDGSSWSAGSPIPAETGTVDSGILALGSGASLTLYAIAEDGTTIRTNAWDGAQWGSWTTFLGAGPPRRYLSGYSASSLTSSALVWTETGAQGHEIHGQLVP